MDTERFARPLPTIKIQSITLRQVNLPPKVVRTDAIQSFA